MQGPNASDRYYCYDARNLLTNVKTGSCNGATVIGLGYDDRGNVNNKNGQFYEFDFGNRLRGVTGVESYRYDGLGRRVQTTHADQSLRVWQYSQSGQLMMGWTGPNNQTTQQYIYLAGSLIAIVDRTWPAQTIASIKFQHTDALGTPVAETDTAGGVVQRSEYDPYGRLNNRPLTDGPGYTGHYQDAATGLTYMQQRYYDPKIGRFLSRDPVTADANTGSNFNAYWYANNNPYRFIDPDGRSPVNKSQACGDGIYCGPDITHKDLPNGETPAGPFEPHKTKGEVIGNGMVQRNEAVKSNVATLRSAMDMKGHKGVPLIVTGGESHVVDGGE